MKSNVRLERNKRGIECLNCKQPLSSKDNFCSNCGQVNDLKPLSIKQYLTEFLSGFFSFDTRTLNTLFPLIFKPGKVTNEYIHGSRMKYVNPFQLYLHTSIIFFLITGIFSSLDGYKDIANTYKSKTSKKQKDIGENIKKELIKNGVEIDTTKKLIDFNSDTKKQKKKQKTKTKKKEKNLKILKRKEVLKKLIIKNSDSLFFNPKFINTVKDTLLIKTQKDKIIDELITTRVTSLYTNLITKETHTKDLIGSFQNFRNTYIANLEDKLTQNKIDYKISEKSKMHSEDRFISNIVGDSFFKKLSKFKKCKNKNIGKSLDSLGYKRTTRNIFWYKKVQEVNSFNDDAETRKVYFNNAISKIAVVLFFMLPVFALFMKLFYIRRKVSYTEHLVFIFHVQTVFFLMLLLEIIIERTVKTSAGIPIFIALFLAYLVIAMRKFYKQSKWKTFFKFILLNMTYFFLSIIGGVFVMFLAFVM